MPGGVTVTATVTVEALGSGAAAFTSVAQTSCSNCTQYSGCGLLNGRPRLVELPSHGALSPGQRLEVRIGAGEFLRLLLLCYLLPAGALLAGGGLGLAVSGNDWGTLLGAVGGLGVGCVALRLYDSRLGPLWHQRLRIAGKPQPTA